MFSPKLQIDPNKSIGWTLGQSVNPNESNVRNESHVALFRHQRVHSFCKQPENSQIFITIQWYALEVRKMIPLILVNPKGLN